MAQKYKQYVLGTPSIYTEIPVQSVENSQEFSFGTDGIHYLQKNSNNLAGPSQWAKNEKKLNQ